MMNRHTLDVRHQLCPIPVIRTQNEVNRLPAGDLLEVVCTDPGTLHDIPAWCRIHGHKVLASKQGKDEIRFVLEVCEPT
jgi:tRNA 2-thiouridine synthesizing protein A